ncbi:plasmid partitioning protein RepB [Microvirga tunisiensis]|uniref:Plasmid partitioning protein RepB n=1 Tax=Microvirga tunisiensis TaxID=2108360 RepID=A0A5N7MI31_9HYPH|nr:plasmid partitioning protein RepB [Microvirga tunisiensis]MPR06188.1 plasmid partitioning protein RepB [Microvirga tunisiensis]MPR26069.1 plasmid partitioning protein RepB [Microvirga tunisiensis]
MNKRMDAIRSAINSHQSDVLSGDNKPAPLPRVSSGSVRSMKESFSDVERENSELRERLNSAAAVQDVDPSLIDPSPIADRFHDKEDAGFKALKVSIQERGQEVPVLLRVHPDDPGRYQSAYGHRRIRAARELGLPVKAVIRSLTDQELVLAQGIENSARQDLSFIERAAFAARLEDAGHDRSVVQSALSIDRAEASKLVSVARSIPTDIIEAVGRAPKAGRPRWLKLAEVMKASKPAVKAVRAVIKSPNFTSRPSDERFRKVFAAASAAPEDKEAAKTSPRAVLSRAGKKIAQVKQSGHDLKISLDQGLDAAFASFLVERLPDLFASFEGTSGRDEPGEA